MIEREAFKKTTKKVLLETQFYDLVLDKIKLNH